MYRCQSRMQCQWMCQFHVYTTVLHGTWLIGTFEYVGGFVYRSTDIQRQAKHRPYIDFATYNIAVDGAAMIKTNNTGCNINNGSNLALSPL